MIKDVAALDEAFVFLASKGRFLWRTDEAERVPGSTSAERKYGWAFKTYGILEDGTLYDTVSEAVEATLQKMYDTLQERASDARAKAQKDITEASDVRRVLGIVQSARPR